MLPGTLTRCTDLDTCGLFRVLEVARRLSVPFELKEMLEAVIRASLEVLDAERGSVFLYDGETDELYSKVATGEKEIRFPASQGIAGESARTRKLINVDDCYADPRFNREIDKKTGFRTRNMLSIPLVGLKEELVGVLQVLNKSFGPFTGDDESLSKTLAAQCAVAIQRARLIEALVLKEKMERDLAIARDIQQAVLPRELPLVEGYEVACWAKPADETGGDVYDAVLLDDQKIAFLMGDATGHGVGPALSITQMRAMFRVGLRLDQELDALMKQIDWQLKEDLADNRFITAFAGILDPRTHRLDYRACGQGPLIHFHAEKDEIEYLDASSLPLGVMPGVSLPPPSPRELRPGDIFAVLSDGFFEYAAPSEEQFGKERIAALIRSSGNAPLSELIERLLKSLTEFSQGSPQDDDMTAVLVRRKLVIVT